MRNMYHLQVTLLLFLGMHASAYMNGWSKDDFKGESSCHWTRVSASGHTYNSFLQHSGNASSSSLRLFHSKWTEDQRLVDCVVSDKSTLIESYLSLCRDENVGNFSHVPDHRVNISRLLAPRSPCAKPLTAKIGASQRMKRDLRLQEESGSTNQSHADVSVLKRQKRGWIVPGTLWCGMGNKANSYEDLGVFHRTDKCCRKHDHCKETIAPFVVSYGLMNKNLYTISNCDCDRKFRKCLLGVNNTISNMVGYTFFNILKVPCFVLTPTLQCSKENWWSMCDVSQLFPQAVLRNAATYSSLHPVQENEETVPTSMPVNTVEDEFALVTKAVNTTEATEDGDFPGSESQTSNQPRPRCRHHSPDRLDHQKPEIGRVLEEEDCEKLTIDLENHTSKYVPWTTSLNTTEGSNSILDITSRDHMNNQENALPTEPDLTPDTVPSNHLSTVQEIGHKEKKLLCQCYRYLDKCAHKIFPGEERYGLHNPDSKTLYHCSCTRRLALKLSRLPELNAVDSQLLDFVSLSCFRLSHSHNCSTENGCTAYLSKNPPIRKALKKWSDVQQDVSCNKIKRENPEQGKRRQWPARLYRRCLVLCGSRLLQSDKEESECQRGSEDKTATQ